MRRLLILTAFLYLGLSSVACVSGPKPKDVLAVNFRTPEDTFRSFQTALRGNLVDLEYRCFSDRLKEEMGSQVFYRVKRDEVLSDQPLIKLAATAEIIRSTREPGGNHCRLILQIDNLFFKRTFAVDLVQEGYYDVFDEDGIAEGLPTRWNRIASTRWDGDAEVGELILRVPMPEGYESIDELTGITAGLAWKIDAFIASDTP